jgi:hypothetical protein
MVESRQPSSLIFRIAGIVLGLLCAFFLFYFIRLLFVTRGLTVIRTGGQGAYVGAVMFPVLAVLFGWGSYRCFRGIRR